MLGILSFSIFIFLIVGKGGEKLVWSEC